MGLDLLDFCGINPADDCHSGDVEVPTGAVYDRREGGFLEDVPQPGTEEGGLDVLCRDARVRGL